MYLHWTRRTRTFNVSILSIQKRTMNKNLCQLCPNIMPTIIVTLGQRWANVILKIFWRWANVAPTCWANVGTLCTYNVGPTLKANVGPTKWTMLAQRWANVCVLSGLLYSSSRWSRSTWLYSTPWLFMRSVGVEVCLSLRMMKVPGSRRTQYSVVSVIFNTIIVLYFLLSFFHAMANISIILSHWYSHIHFYFPFSQLMCRC